MEPNKKKIIDLGILETDEVSGVKKISLVEEPAIMLDFHYFNTQKFEEATCLSCDWKWDLAEDGQDPYICHKCGVDNAPITEKFESFNDYPESAKNAAKRALEFRDSHPEVDCGTAVGWQRANQLAKGENISEETIARMASFARHLQYKDVPYTEGCGGLMVDAWGGQAGIEWASNKLKEIRGEDFDIDVSGLPTYVDQIPKKKKDIVTRAILAEKAKDMDYSWTKDEYITDTIIALAKELGTKEEDLAKLFDMQFANANAGGNGTNPSAAFQQKDRELILYKYTGRIGSNSRDFCVQMVNLDLFYTKDQIQAMSNIAVNAGFGIDGAAEYSIWSFKGGPNCKHHWNDYLVKSSKDGKITYQDLGPAAGRAGQNPIKMPKQGYYNAVNDSIFSFAAEEQQILVGPAMVPDMRILRVDEDGQKYFVKFSPETIKEIALKYFKEGRVHELNTDHAENNAGAYIFESWLVETADDKANTLYGYNVPIGTWMISVKVEDAATWARVKAGELRGFSIEGILIDMEELEAMKTYERIKKILGTDI
jgi:hypothetical protein